MLHLSVLRSEAFVNSICKSVWFNLFNISRSRSSVTTDAPQILIQAYVVSKIDYCNRLLYGIPDKKWNRIQWIQNYATRLVLMVHKFSHSTPAVATLHWLPVNRRVDFKIVLLVSKPKMVKPQLINSDSKVNGANMGPHVGPMNFVIWEETPSVYIYH